MLRLREAGIRDSSTIMSFIRDLAAYERKPQAVAASERNLQRDGFADNPKFHVVIAEWNRKPVGMAFYFYNYSTWKGRAGLYLEDIIVEPAFRGRGIGKALMAYLARIAIKQNCYGIRWEVLDWNKPAIQFYLKLGAASRARWQSMQLEGQPLQSLAKLALRTRRQHLSPGPPRQRQG